MSATSNMRRRRCASPMSERARRQPWDAAGWSSFVDRRLGEKIAAASPASTFEPIFVIGMPRTGTTLVSTLLERLDGVRDRGELNWIAAVYAQLRDLNRLDDAQALRACADLIQAHMRRDDAPARFYVDKNPLNFAYVDFIAAMFPRARFVYCRRDAARHGAIDLVAAFRARGARVRLRFREHRAGRERSSAFHAAVARTVRRSHHRCRLRRHRRRPRCAVEAARRIHRRHADGGCSRCADRHHRQRLAGAPAGVSRSVGRWKSYAPYLPELAALAD